MGAMKAVNGRIEVLMARVNELVDENAGLLVRLGEIDTLREQLATRDRILKDGSVEMEKLRVRAEKAEDKVENLHTWLSLLVALAILWVPTMFWHLWKIFS